MISQNPVQRMMNSYKSIRKSSLAALLSVLPVLSYGQETVRLGNGTVSLEWGREEAGYVLTHLDKNTGQYRRGEKKKICRFLLVLAGMCLCGLFALFCRNTGENLLHDTVGIYVEQAERAADEETRRE